MYKKRVEKKKPEEILSKSYSFFCSTLLYANYKLKRHPINVKSFLTGPQAPKVSF